MRLFDQDELVQVIMQAAQQQAGAQESFITAFISSYDPGKHRVRCIVPSWLNPGTSEYVQTGWVPLSTPWMGNGWGMQFAPFGGATQTNPTGGEQVKLCVYSFENGTYIADALLWSDKTAVALPTLQAGEGILKHVTGTYIRFKADGSLAIFTNDNLDLTATADLNATVGGALTATVTGDVSVTGQQNITQTATGSAQVSAGTTATIEAAATAFVEALSVQMGSAAQISGATLQPLVNALFQAVYNGHYHVVSGISGGSSSVNSDPPDAAHQMGSGQLTTTVTAG